MHHREADFGETEAVSELPGRLATGGGAAAARDNISDRIRRQIRLQQESRCGTRGDEFCEVAWRVGRNQDDQRRFAATVPGQQAGKIKPALVSERQVDEDDLRSQLAGKLHSFSGCAGSSEDALSLALKETSRNVGE